MAPHSSTLAWKIPWTEEPGGLQSMGWLRVGHEWATSLSLFTFMHWRRKWQPTPVFLPGESQRCGSLVGCYLWGRTELDTTGVTQQQQQQHYVVSFFVFYNFLCFKVCSFWYEYCYSSFFFISIYMEYLLPTPYFQPVSVPASEVRLFVVDSIYMDIAFESIQQVYDFWLVCLIHLHSK